MNSPGNAVLSPSFPPKVPAGSGLGLAMVYGMMRRHQGGIEIESELGRGTVMRLVLNPGESSAKPQPAAAAAVTMSPLRILCIDDDNRIGAMLQQILGAHRHSVEVANGGQSGLEAFRRAKSRGEPFQVVITDLGMPNVDGRQIVRVVKAGITRNTRHHADRLGRHDGPGRPVPKDADAVLSKPGGMSRLQEVLAQVTKICPA